MTSKSDWRKKLTPEQYCVLREKGTELPFSGRYVNHKEDGTYVCAGCGSELFDSKTKFDSHCGWPSFFAAFDDRVELKDDRSQGVCRIEVVCRKCNGHLGHVFDDGPRPTGKRYCINSVSLEFRKRSYLYI